MSDEARAGSEISIIANSDNLNHRWVTLAEEKHQVHLELFVSPARHSEIAFLTRQQAKIPLWHKYVQGVLLHLKVERYFVK